MGVGVTASRSEGGAGAAGALAGAPPLFRPRRWGTLGQRWSCCLPALTERRRPHRSNLNNNQLTGTIVPDSWSIGPAFHSLLDLWVRGRGRACRCVQV